MTLGELIAVLESQDPDKVIQVGFDYPHSHRGDYAQLAFRPKPLARVGDMLKAARSAIDAEYEGWKGGEYKMGTYSDCYLATPGDVGEEIGPMLLGYLLADTIVVCEGAGSVTNEVTHGWCAGCRSYQRIDSDRVIQPHVAGAVSLP